nr:hypothetical protein BaRGS_013317 [Batillaria attramentaria]
MSDNENEKVDVKSVEDLRRTVAQLQVQLETDRKRLASSQRTENSTVFLSDQRRIARFTDRPQEPGDVSLQDWLDDIRAAITFRDGIVPSGKLTTKVDEDKCVKPTPTDNTSHRDTGSPSRI